MKPRPLIKCRACGHFGHPPGSRCPLRNLVPDDRPAAKARVELAKLFPHRPDLVAALEAMQESWVPKAERKTVPPAVDAGEACPRRATCCSPLDAAAGAGINERYSDTIPHLASRLAERWGARVRA